MYHTARIKFKIGYILYLGTKKALYLVNNVTCRAVTGFCNYSAILVTSICNHKNKLPVKFTVESSS